MSDDLDVCWYCGRPCLDGHEGCDNCEPFYVWLDRLIAKHKPVLDALESYDKEVE